MVGVDDSSIEVESWCRPDGQWYGVCICHMNRVNSYSGCAAITAL